MTTYLHMKSGDVYEVDYLSIQPFQQHNQTDFVSYILDHENTGLFEADILIDKNKTGHIVFCGENVESIEQVDTNGKPRK
jgi:hypothetical protein